MSRDVRLSKKAAKRLDDLLDFLEERWSSKVKANFKHKFDATLKHIQLHPESFPASEMIPGLRKCVVTKQTTFYYKYSEINIDIIAIFDNRQDPDLLISERNP